MPEPNDVSFDRLKVICAPTPWKCQLPDDLVAHLSSMRGVGEIRDVSQVNAVLFFRSVSGHKHENRAETLFLADPSRRALLQKFERHEYGAGNISYYRKG